MASKASVAASSSKEKSSSEGAMEKHAIHEFKRSGDFDRIRKETLREWESSEEGVAFLANLKKIVSAEIDRDPSLLARDRGKAATLMGGSVERSQLYPDARLAASKKIFQSDAFKTRVYESLKQYFPKQDDAKDKKEDNEVGIKKGSNEDEIKKEEKQVTTAQEAAMDFIMREGGT